MLIKIMNNFNLLIPRKIYIIFFNYLVYTTNSLKGKLKRLIYFIEIETVSWNRVQQHCMLYRSWFIVLIRESPNFKWVPTVQRINAKITCSWLMNKPARKIVSFKPMKRTGLRRLTSEKEDYDKHKDTWGK